MCADQGNNICQYHLAYNFGEGRGTAKDYAQAFKYLLMSAEFGNPNAQYLIGFFYEMGYGTEVNKNLARHYY